MSKVKFEISGSLGVITLNDPPMNLISKDLVQDVITTMEKAEQNRLRGMLLKVDEGSFSVGADVNMFNGMSPRDAGESLTVFMSLIQKIESLPYPTMAAVKGICLAGGLELALAFDLIWAADTAAFGQVEALIGAIPFGGGAQRLAARVGIARAKEIVFSARFYQASQFEQWNIINRVLPEAELNDKAMKYMQKLSDSGATVAFDKTKQILNSYMYRGLSESDRLNVQLSPSIFETEDFKKGIISFATEGPGKAKFSGH
jgi:enoyl-CoA hydratase/carnithine racemase